MIRSSPPGRQVVVGQGPRVCDHQADGFRRVDRASPAQTNQAVALLGLVTCHAGQYVGLGGVGLDLVEDDRSVQLRNHVIDQPRRTQAGVGDDQWPTTPPSPANSSASDLRAPAPKRIRLGKVNIAGIACSARLDVNRLEGQRSGIPEFKSNHGRHGKTRKLK